VVEFERIIEDNFPLSTSIMGLNTNVADALPIPIGEGVENGN
jgi:hypothetical protein